MKKTRDMFVTRHVGEIVQVWLEPVDDPEGELILAVHYTLIPALIAALRAA